MFEPVTRETLRGTLNRLPRVALADLPTPLHDCPRFSEAVGGGVRVLIKRDDLTGLAFGGNKTRKFDFALGDATGAGGHGGDYGRRVPVESRPARPAPR